MFVYVDLFVITPPIEYYLDVSPRLRREQFFKVIFHRSISTIPRLYSPVNSSWSYPHRQCNDC